MGVGPHDANAIFPYKGVWHAMHQANWTDWAHLTSPDLVHWTRTPSALSPNGDWDGTQIVSKAWIAESTRVDTTEGSIARYQYQWWRPFAEEDALLAQGLLGQYIYVDRARDVVIVRLGHTFGPVRWQDIFRQLAAYYE